jgi:hypothetical protein
MRVFALVAILLTAATAAHGQAPAASALADVDRFDPPIVGFAGGLSPNYLAFRSTLATGPAAKAQFEDLLRSGNPAAKLYAAIGLHKFDSAQGRAALDALAKDTTPVSGMSGCILYTSTVGQVATGLAKYGGLATYLADDAPLTEARKF